MNWQVIAWTLGALSMVVSLISAIAERLLREGAPDLARYLPPVQIVMSCAGILGFVLALIFDPLPGMDVEITIGSIAIVVAMSAVYVVAVMILGGLERKRREPAGQTAST